MSPLPENRAKRTSKPPQTVRLDEDQAKNSRAAFSTTVAKALSIIEILASSSDAGINLTELSAALTMPKSTAHRYLATLLELNLAEPIHLGFGHQTSSQKYIFPNHTQVLH